MRDLTRREFLAATVGAASAGLVDAGHAAGDGEVLYNGIRLAEPWPPRNRVLDDVLREPPYLRDPPAVIPIDVGRQLFVDDFLIEENGLHRVFHRARYHPANPVLQPATAWERRDEYADRTGTPPNPSAMVFSDGVFYDPADRLYKMWYMGGYLQHTCLASSADGVTWERPSFDVRRGTNIVFSDLRDSNTVWLNLDAADGRRYKMASYNGSENGMVLSESADGIHWRRVGLTGPTGDRSTMFWNPFRKVWVFSLRAEQLGVYGRFRRYWESRDFASTTWRGDELPYWIKSDVLDPRRPDTATAPELYALDCVAYESIILGLFTIFRGERPEREKPNDICLGFSRDGFHWSRPDRRPFIGVSERVGDWNWANVQSAGGCCLVVGDQLYFYVSGRKGRPGTSLPGVCSTGLATLRRDGFASLTDTPDDDSAPRAVAIARTPNAVTTRPLRFSGTHLFVNANASGGEIRAEILDRSGRVIALFTRDRSVPIVADSTRQEVTWRDGAKLAQLRGEAVRLRFFVTRSHLFSFWITDSPAGASHGYVAAGGPGFSSATDQ